MLRKGEGEVIVVRKGGGVTLLFSQQRLWAPA